MQRIVITMDGGLILDVSASEPVEYLVIDFDTEGADADRLSNILQSDGTTAEAYTFQGIFH